MPHHFTRDFFMAAGHCTREPGRLVSRGTVDTHYLATNGFFYFVFWRYGQPFQSTIGYSAAYLIAARKYEDAWQQAPETIADPHTAAGVIAQARFIAKQLGLIVRNAA